MRFGLCGFGGLFSFISECNLGGIRKSAPISFFVFSKSVSVMTIRQQVKARLALVKRAWQLGRHLTEKEVHETIATALEETKVIFYMIGAITVFWAEVEIGLDYFNGILIMHKSVKDSVLPKSLRLKIAFFKKSFHRIAELAPLRDRADAMISELYRLSVIRHDLVHGAAVDRLPVGFRKLLRIDYEGKDVKERYVTYDFPALTSALNDVQALVRTVDSLFKDTVIILHPDKAKQAFG